MKQKCSLYNSLYCLKALAWVLFLMFCRLDDPHVHCQIKPGVCPDWDPLGVLFSFGWSDSLVSRSVFLSSFSQIKLIKLTSTDCFYPGLLAAQALSCQNDWQLHNSLSRKLWFSLRSHYESQHDPQRPLCLSEKVKLLIIPARFRPRPWFGFGLFSNTLRMHSCTPLNVFSSSASVSVVIKPHARLLSLQLETWKHLKKWDELITSFSEPLNKDKKGPEIPRLTGTRTERLSSQPFRLACFTGRLGRTIERLLDS